MWETEYKGTHASLLSELTSSTREEERTWQNKARKLSGVPMLLVHCLIKYNANIIMVTQKSHDLTMES